MASQGARPGTIGAFPAGRFLAVAGSVVAVAVGLGIYVDLHWLVAALAGVNAATIVLYGYDKAIAGGTRLRVPESVLHLMAICGGTAAAFVSQRAFRHKTVKGRFQAVFWSIALVQLALAGFWVWSWRARPAWMPGFLLPASSFPI